MCINKDVKNNKALDTKTQDGQIDPPPLSWI